MISVLYDHQIFELQRFGGISRIFLELARRLSARTDVALSWYRGYHRDRYATGCFRHQLAHYWSMPQIAQLGGLRPDRVNRQGLRLFAKTIRDGVDIYHPSYFDASLTAVVRSRRLAVTVYDMILERLYPEERASRKWREGKARLVGQADVVFAISEQTRRDVIELYGVDPSRVHLAYPASNITEVVPVGLPPELAGRPFFLYVGARSKYKNFQVLMSAFARSGRLRSDAQVVCFGGTSSFVEPEQRYLAEHGLSDRFRYLSGDDRVLKSLYLGAQALVYTSRYEGFGLPPLEALEAGCPVVCCPVSSIPEVVGDAALFFEPDDADELAVRLESILDSPTLRGDLRSRGALRAGEFSWDRMAEATLAGYRHIL